MAPRFRRAPLGEQQDSRSRSSYSSPETNISNREFQKRAPQVRRSSDSVSDNSNNRGRQQGAALVENWGPDRRTVGASPVAAKSEQHSNKVDQQRAAPINSGADHPELATQSKTYRGKKDPKRNHFTFPTLIQRKMHFQTSTFGIDEVISTR